MIIGKTKVEECVLEIPEDEELVTLMLDREEGNGMWGKGTMGKTSEINLVLAPFLCSDRICAT